MNQLSFGFHKDKSISVDVEMRQLMKKLSQLDNKLSKRAMNAAGTYSARLIDKETSRHYLNVSYKTPPNRKKGFRRRVATKSAFKYSTKRGYGIFKFISALNFKHPEMHIGRWLDQGFTLRNGSKFSGLQLREKAFKTNEKKSKIAFVKTLKYGLQKIASTGTVTQEQLVKYLGDPWR